MADRQGLLSRGAARLLSDRSLTKKASLNAFASGVDYGARVAVGLVLYPLMLSRLGDTIFGVWQVLLRLFGQAASASGRPAEALKWTLANQQSSTDYEGKRLQVGNAVAVWLLFLPLQLLIGALLGWYAPVWLGVPSSLYPSIRIAAAILAINLVLLSLVDLPRGVLQGENLGYKRVGLSTSLVLLGGGLMGGALLLGAGIVGVALASLATTVLSGAVYLRITSTFVPWFGFARPRWSDVKRFTGLSWWFLVWNLVMRVMRGADLVVLGIAGSAGLVTSYTLARYAPEAVASLIAILIFSIMPGLGGLIGAGDTAKTDRVRNEMMAGTWLLGTVSGCLVLIWEASFLDMWVGKRYYPGVPATVLIVIMALQMTMIRNDSNIIDLTLKVRRKVLLGVLSAAVSVALSSVLVLQGWGIVGMATGFIVGRAILSVAYPLMVGRLLGVTPLRQVGGIVRPLMVMVLLLSISTYAGREPMVDSWAGLIVGASLSGAVLLPIAYIGGLSGDVRRSLWRRARRVARLT